MEVVRVKPPSWIECERLLFLVDQRFGCEAYEAGGEAHCVIFVISGGEEYCCLLQG